VSIPEGSEESDTDQIPVRDEPVGIKSKLAKVLISKVKDEAVGVPAKEFNKYKALDYSLLPPLIIEIETSPGATRASVAPIGKLCGLQF